MITKNWLDFLVSIVHYMPEFSVRLLPNLDELINNTYYVTNATPNNINNLIRNEDADKSKIKIIYRENDYGLVLVEKSFDSSKDSNILLILSNNLLVQLEQYLNVNNNFYRVYTYIATYLYTDLSFYQYEKILYHHRIPFNKLTSTWDYKITVLKDKSDRIKDILNEHIYWIPWSRDKELLLSINSETKHINIWEE